VSKKNVARLKRELKRYRITHDAVAAACMPPVHRTTVVRALLGDIKSANVTGTAERLVAEAKTLAGETTAA